MTKDHKTRFQRLADQSKPGAAYRHWIAKYTDDRATYYLHATKGWRREAFSRA